MPILDPKNIGVRLKPHHGSTLVKILRDTWKFPHSLFCGCIFLLENIGYNICLKMIFVASKSNYHCEKWVVSRKGSFLRQKSSDSFPTLTVFSASPLVESVPRPFLQRCKRNKGFFSSEWLIFQWMVDVCSPWICLDLEMSGYFFRSRKPRRNKHPDDHPQWCW